MKPVKLELFTYRSRQNHGQHEEPPDLNAAIVSTRQTLNLSDFIAFGGISFIACVEARRHVGGIVFHPVVAAFQVRTKFRPRNYEYRVC